MADLIVKSGVKEQLEGYNVSADLYEALDDTVADFLSKQVNGPKRTIERLSNPGICNLRHSGTSCPPEPRRLCRLKRWFS